MWSERWRLASLSTTDMLRIALGAVIVGLVFVLFHFQGNSADSLRLGRSVLSWMVVRWNDSTVALGAADTSHGWLIPIASIGLVWWRRRDLLAAPKSVSWAGLAVVVASLFLHWVGAKAQQPRLSLLALIGLIWGIPFYFYGKRVAQIILFPCAYLIFCIPLNFFDSLTFSLRLYMTIMVNAILNGLGIAFLRSGTALYSVYGDYALEVADPCSGIRSLLAMTAITALYAYMTQRTLVRKWILFLMAVPLAMVGNMVRILTISLVSEAFGNEVGAGLYHDFSGYMIFLAITIPLMIWVGNLIDSDFRRQVQKWKDALSHPRS
jgi:exosortase